MADMKDNPFFKIGALMGETNNKNIALQATIEAQEAEIKRLRSYMEEIVKYMEILKPIENTMLHDVYKIAQAALKKGE